MKLTRSRIIIISALALLPALFLCLAGLADLFFDFEPANKTLEMLMAQPLFGILLSPFVVLGGPFLAILLNLPRLCSLTVAYEHEEWLVAFALKRAPWHLASAALASLLLTLLLAYAFVENFKIVAR
jgi:hypothetical protein